MAGAVLNLLWGMLETQKGVDFEFHFVDEAEKVIDKIGVHSLILASQSPVFEAMVNGKLKESSPLVLQETNPKAFKNLLRILYEQPCNVFSTEEAYDLYELGSRYDVEKARLIAKKFLLDHIDNSNVKLVHKCASLFADKELTKSVWDFLEKSLVKAFNATFIGEAGVPDSHSFEIQNYSGNTLVKSLEKHIEEIRALEDVNLKVSRAIGLFETLELENEKLFKMIVPNESLKVVPKIEWTPPTSSFLRLNKAFNMEASCNYCVASAHVIGCASSPLNASLKPIYDKYKHDDLSRYSVEDIKLVYEKLKDKIK